MEKYTDEDASQGAAAEVGADAHGHLQGHERLDAPRAEQVQGAVMAGSQLKSLH